SLSNPKKFIKGANILSTFDPETKTDIIDAITGGSTPFQKCPKGPYAACMTAPCKINKDGETATCKCPVFYGPFQLVNSESAGSPGFGLVQSASYSPALDTAGP